MDNIRAYIDRGETDKAVDALYVSLYSLINTIPNVELTKYEFDELIPTLFEKLEDPDRPIHNKTTDPGDDIDVKPSKGLVVVKFDGPADMELPHGYVEMLAVGQEFEFEVPEIEGYVADIPAVKGMMGGEDICITVTYVKAPQVAADPLYGSLCIKKDYEGKRAGWMLGVLKPDPVIHAYIGGKYILDKFDKEEDAKPDAEMPTGYWWPGITLHAYKELENEDEYKKVPARYLINATGEWVNFTLGDTKIASEDSVYDGGSEKQSYIWVPITPYQLDRPNGADGYYHYLVQIDWNLDGLYEQCVDIAVQPKATFLYDAEVAFKSDNFSYPVIKGR